MNWRVRLVCAAAAASMGLTCAQGAGPNAAREALNGYLNDIAARELAARREAVAKIGDRAAAEQRKAMFRRKALELIGGLPEHRGAVAVKQFGSLTGDGFRVEKVAYESLPGFWVTADIYVPSAGTGPFPAVVIAPGHGVTGKLGDSLWGANLARNGVVALSYDPLGQGERLQYYDPDLKTSKVGNPTGEHGEANVGPLLIGETVERYMLNDAMRGIDYLTARKDVDAKNIGAFGCSGGGTATAYLSALDDRVTVAATGCYITSFDELLKSPTGVQDAEQSLPGFIQSGFDFADWVEAFAPKPYAIVSTTEDMFPFAGARQTYEEARRIYGLYSAQDRIEWITGPGPHGNLMPIASKILSFLVRNLKHTNTAVEFSMVRVGSREELICTPTGQVATSLGGETVYTLNQRRTAAVVPAPRALVSRTGLDSLRERVQSAIRTLSAVAVKPGGEVPQVTLSGAEQRAGYRVETLTLRGADGIEVPGFIGIPDAAGAKPAILMLGTFARDRFAAVGGDFDRLAKAGRLVMVLAPRPTPPGTESIKSPLLGLFNLLSLRAFLVGKTLVGMRMDDAIGALNWLCARKDVDASSLTLYGDGASGIVALHTAAIDARVTRVVAENTLVSYRMIADQPLHRNVSEDILPGVLLKYDVGDLVLAVAPRPVTLVNPREALGLELTETEYRKHLAYVLDTAKTLGFASPRWVSRGFRDPLPVE